MDLEQIKDLVEVLESSKLKKLAIKSGDFELQLEKDGEEKQVLAHLPPPYQMAGAASYAQQFMQAATTAEQSKIGHKPSGAPQPPVEKSGKYITSPMVGTFYSTPSPEKPPFVKVGDRVEANTVVCIVEAMKVMNEVKAGVQGTVVEILADNSQPVEFGSKLFRIE